MLPLPPVLSSRESAPEVSPGIVEPSLLLTMASWTQGAPAIAYLVTRRRSIPSSFIALGGLLTLLSTAIATIWARHFGNNYVVGYFTIPVIAAAYMLALAEWQVTYIERVTFRIGIGMFAGVFVLLAMFFESVTHFGQYSHTLYSLVLLVGALWTLGRRSFEQTEGIALETDWFWVAFGLAIYGAATASTAALGNILLARERTDLFLKVWNLRGAFVFLSFASISWGVFRGQDQAPPSERTA